MCRHISFLYSVLSNYSLPCFYILVVYCDVLLLFITLCMYREHERNMYLLCTVLCCCCCISPCVCIENTRETCTCCVLVVYCVVLLYITLCMNREHERDMYLLCTGCVLCCCCISPCVCIENTRETCTC